MYKSNIQREMDFKFLEIVQYEMSGKISKDILNYLIFDKYPNLFYALSEQEQWEVRFYIDAYNKIYG